VTTAPASAPSPETRRRPDKIVIGPPGRMKPKTPDQQAGETRFMAASALTTFRAATAA